MTVSEVLRLMDAAMDPILTLSLFAAIAALVVIRLTFRHAASVREAVISPAVFAVCGALIGISIGMVWFSDREGRVSIETGIVLLVVGACSGAMVGAGAREMYARLHRGKAIAFILVMMFLAGCIGAPIGWIAGVAGAGSPSEYDLQYDYEAVFERLSRSRMMLGIAIGSGIGLLLGLSEVVSRRRETT